MILTKHAMQREILSGTIKIYPMHEELFNPNSYNVRLSDKLKIYNVDRANFCTRMLRKVLPGKWADRLRLPKSEIDLAEEPDYYEVTIPEAGYLLQPGVLYLGSTIERTTSPNHVPLYEGRSSTGRVGLESHVCAGWGDVGFDGTWTLEIRVVYPIRVYPGMEIGQVGFIAVEGEIDPYGSDNFASRYQNQLDPNPYKGYTDFHERRRRFLRRDHSNTQKG